MCLFMNLAYKTQELHVSTLANVLKLKNTARLRETSKMARRLMMSCSSSTTKDSVQSKRDTLNVQDSENDSTQSKDSSIITRTDRPVGTSLNVPNTAIENAKYNLSTFSSTPKPQVTVTDLGSITNITETSEQSKICKYFFSKPTEVFSESMISKNPPVFSFLSPEKNLDKITSNNTTNEFISSIVGKAVEREVITTTNTLYNNKSKTCSGCKVELSTELPDILFCNDCQKKNDDTASLKITTSSICPQEVPAISNSDEYESLFCEKATSSEILEADKIKKKVWQCNICLFENKDCEVKCKACLSLKPGTEDVRKEVATIDVSKYNDTLKNIAKKQAEKWECPCCLIRIDNDKSKCPCCESEKPGSYNKSGVKFNFGMTPNTTFKFGIDPKFNQVSETCKSIESKTEIKETNNNVLPKSTFKFGMPVDKSDEVSKTNTEEPKQMSMPKFSFGIYKETENKSMINDVPDVPDSLDTTTTSSTEIEKNDKPQEVSNIESNVIKEPTLSFALDSKSNPSSQASPVLSSSFLINASQSFLNVPISKTENPTPQETTIKAISHLPTTSTSTSTLFEKSEPHGINHSFTVPPIFQKNNDNQSLNTTSTSIFGNIQSNSTQSTPTGNLFQQNNANQTCQPSSPFSSKPSVSMSKSGLFKMNEVTNTTSSPLLGFGINTQSSSSTKPVFQFTFGSNDKTNTKKSEGEFGRVPDNNLGQFNNPIMTNLSSSLVSNTNEDKSTVTNVLNDNNLSVFSPGSNNNLQLTLAPNTESSSQPSVTFRQFPSAVATNTAGSMGMAMSQHAPMENNSWSLTNRPANNLFSTNSNPNTPKPVFRLGSNIAVDINGHKNPSIFSNIAQTDRDVFGNANGQAQTNRLPSTVFQNTSSTPVFGNQDSNNTNSAQSTLGLFGQQSSSGYQLGGNPIPAPTFNFPSGPSNGVFAFGQVQPQQQQQQQTGVYGFGAGATPQVQFKVGSATNTGVRRMRKAVRRTTPR